MNIGHNLERFVKVQDAKRLRAIQRGAITESDIGERVFHIPEEAGIAFLSLDEVGILVQDIFNRLIMGCLIDHLNLQIWGFETKLLNKSLFLFVFAFALSSRVFRLICLGCILVSPIVYCILFLY